MRAGSEADGADWQAGAVCALQGEAPAQGAGTAPHTPYPGQRVADTQGGKPMTVTDDPRYLNPIVTLEQSRKLRALRYPEDGWPQAAWQYDHRSRGYKLAWLRRPGRDRDCIAAPDTVTALLWLEAEGRIEALAKEYRRGMYAPCSWYAAIVGVPWDDNRTNRENGELWENTPAELLDAVLAVLP